MRPLVLLLVVVPALALAGCFNGGAPPPGGDGLGPDEGPRHELAFSGEDAMEHVRAQVLLPNGSFRYRVPGTPGNAYVAQYIENELALLGYDTDFQNWGSDYACRDVPMRNVVGVRPGATNRTLFLGAHYDTRIVADKDPDPANRHLPVPGANDGASGVAVLLELAASLKDRAPNLTLVFAFFDAEDGGDLPQDRYPCSTGWIMGSLRFLSWIRDNVPRATNVTEGVIIVDMVGDPELTLLREGYSAKGPGRELQDLLWETGARLGHEDVFLDRAGPDITDDHRAFLDAPAVQVLGAPLPAVDIIHLDAGRDPFPDSHHTVHDDLDAVSPASLGIVGRTVEHVVLDLDRAPRCAYARAPACSPVG